MANERPKTRYAAKVKTLAIALGLPTSRRQLLALQEWSRQADFPGKARNGWPIDAVKGWIDSHAEWIMREKARAELADVDGKMPSDKIVRALSGGERADAGCEMLDTGFPKIAEGLPAIAAILAKRYGDRVGIQIRKQEISDWRNGRRLDSGTPPFPAPTEANRYDVARSCEWFERYILPQHSNETGTPNLQGINQRDLSLAQMRGEMERLEHERLLRETEKGLWVRVSDADRELVGALKLYDGLARAEIERAGPNRRRELLRAILSESTKFQSPTFAEATAGRPSTSEAPNPNPASSIQHPASSPPFNLQQLVNQFYLEDLKQSQAAFDGIRGQCAQLAAEPDSTEGNEGSKGAVLTTENTETQRK